MPLRVASHSILPMLWALVFGLAPFTVSAAVKPLRVEARLIFASDSEESPEGGVHQPVGEKFQKRLQGMFKWKHYYLAKQETVDLVLKKARTIKLSEECSVELTYLGNNQIECTYGEGKSKVRKRQTLKPGEIFSIGGHRKNDTAWFVTFALPE